MEGNEGETMDRETSVDSHVQYVSVTQTREEFSTYDNPLVEHPSTADSTFHFPMEVNLLHRIGYSITHQMTL